MITRLLRRRVFSLYTGIGLAHFQCGGIMGKRLFAGFLLFSTILIADPKQKIIIFYGSIGMGHLTAARAIEKEILAQDPTAEVVIKDIREFIPKWNRDLSLKGYDLATKIWPSLYEKGFRSYMQNGAKIDDVSKLMMAKSFGIEPVVDYLYEQQPTLLISTFNPGTEGLIKLRKEGKISNIPIAWTHTDFVDEEYFRRLSREIDMTFLPHEALRQRWIEEGVLPEKVMTTGMAINRELFRPISKEERSTFLKSKGLNPDVPTISLLGGSAGVGNFVEQVRGIEKNFDGPVQIFAMVGKNDSQKKKLQAMKLRDGVSLTVFGFTPQKELLPYQQSSDVVSTKSGGLAPMEIAHIGRPMILLDINGGQERDNAQFLGSQKMALVTADQKDVGKLARQIVDSKALQTEMTAAQGEFAKMIHPEQAAKWALDTSKERGVRLLSQNRPPKPPPTTFQMICGWVMGTKVANAPSN